MKQGIKWYFILMGIVLLIGLAGFTWRIVFSPMHVANRAIDAGYDIVDRVVDGDNIIFNYENFFNMYQAAKQQVGNINSAQKSIDDFKETYGEDATKWPKDVRTEYNRLKSNIDDYKLMYGKAVADYNSKSKQLTRNLFKDSNLPYQLPDDPDDFFEGYRD